MGDLCRHVHTGHSHGQPRGGAAVRLYGRGALGGLFGDHSSPISETTILSSTGAGCAQIEHFRTQLPYALFNGMISLFGFLLAGMHGEYWILSVLIALQIFLLMSLERLITLEGAVDT